MSTDDRLFFKQFFGALTVAIIIWIASLRPSFWLYSSVIVLDFDVHDGVETTFAVVHYVGAAVVISLLCAAIFAVISYRLIGSFASR